MSTAVLLSGCGGGGSEADTATAPLPDVAAGINGIVATGAALVDADVKVIDGSGNSVCTEANIVTRANGSYHCTLTSGKTAPFFVVATDAAGLHAPLIGIAPTTPQTNAPVIANATPLTTAILAQAGATAASAASIDLTALAPAKGKVLAQIADVLTAVNAPEGFDPFSTAIVAATADAKGNAGDEILDLLRFSTVDGVPMITTIDRLEDAQRLADAGTTSPVKLAPPAASAIGLTTALKPLRAALEACFALPVGTRVTRTNDAIAPSAGGPEVTVVAKECGDIADDAYFDDGQRAGQSLYRNLTDASMTGASFALIDVMQFIDDASAVDADRAMVDIRYTKADGTAGDLSTRLLKTTDRSTTPATIRWALFGNQQPAPAAR